MIREAWSRLDVWARRMIPFGLAILFVLLMVLPYPLPGFSAMMPMLALGAVVFWAIHHPRLLPASAVFAIGLLQDILGGALLGSGAVVLLLAYGLAVSQRRFFHNKAFPVVWWGFAMIASGVAILSWILASLLAWTWISPEQAFFQLALTICVYPLLTWVLHMAQRLLPAEA